MAGANYARPQNPVAVVYGNPATMTQLNDETSFNFGMSYLGVDASVNHDRSITGAPSKAKSGAKDHVLPAFGVKQRLLEKMVVGGGLQIITVPGADPQMSTDVTTGRVSSIWCKCCWNLSSYASTQRWCFSDSRLQSIGIGVALQYGTHA